MYVATARLTLRLFDSSSLKDKRQVTRSVLARLREKFDISAAEVGAHERWNLAELGLACVSGDAQHALDVIDRAIHYVEESRPDLEIADVATEVVTVE